MADYGFVHEGRVYTPNGTAGIDPAASDARNRAMEADELAAWAGQPDHFVGYYDFPAMTSPDRPSPWRQGFEPRLAGSRVTTWLGSELGRITKARVYTNNFGARLVSITVHGSNGATYHGRASWDWGSIVRLHRSKVVSRA